jgi:branched-chain amino acid transport system ATP-binding protein
MRRGIALVPEGRRIFPRMTVMENLQMGADARRPGQLRRRPEARVRLFPILQERQAQRGGTLSGGEQQMLAIGRALMSRPRCCCSTSPRSAWRRST